MKKLWLFACGVLILLLGALANDGSRHALSQVTETFSAYVTGLPSATLPLGTGDKFYVLQGGVSKTVTEQNIALGCSPATTSVLGCVKPDGVTTFTNPSGVISSVGGGGGGGGTNLGWVVATAAPFNATGNGTTDDTAAIQAAIDFAASNGIQTIYLPKAANCYKITTSLYLDPPGNLRSNFTSPPLAAFSMALIGEPGQGNHEDSFGSKICPSFASSPFLIVGTGQGMKVANISLIGVGGLEAEAYRCGRIPTGGPGPAGAPEAGIYIAGGGGGSTRALIEQVMIENAFYGIAVGLNNGGLGDANSFRKILINNVCTGIEYGSNQNFINDCIECELSGFHTGLDVSAGGGMTIVGGNWSALNVKSAGVMTLSAWSAITATNSGGSFDYTFTATLGAPTFSGVTSYAYGDIVSSGGQVWFCLGFSPACTGTTPSLSVPSTWQTIDKYLGSIFNAFNIVTAHYGVIPMTMTAFTQATSIISLKILTPWSYFYFPLFNAVANADLQAEVQTGTTLYASETVTIFRGAGINATGVHIENPGAPTRLIDSITFLAGSAGNVLTDIRNNYSPTAIGSPTGSPASKALFYATQTFPYIFLEDIPTEIKSSAWGMVTTDPYLVDISASPFGQSTFRVDGSNFEYTPMVQRVYGNGGGAAGQFYGSSMLGFGQFENVPFTPVNPGNPGTGDDGPDARKNIPHWGVRPAPINNACITTFQLNAVSNPLNPWVFTGALLNFGYPFLWGGQPYVVCDQLVGQVATSFMSTHRYYSMGQNLTTTNVSGLSWSYKGQGAWVYADANTLKLMFPGLGVILNDGTTDHIYLVTGVWPSLGYFTVVLADAANGGQLSGTKTAIITGTTIKQDPFNLQFNGATSATIAASATNTQAAATKIPNNALAQITSIGGANYAVALPKCFSGAQVAISLGASGSGGNIAGNTPLQVYPQNGSGDTINAGAANAPLAVTLPAAAPVLFLCFVPGAWVTK